jgi:hypothetical protein
MLRSGRSPGAICWSDTELKERGSLNTKLVLIVAVVVALVAAGLLRSRSAEAEATRDGQTIAQLKKAGADITKPHSIDFFFYFPSQEAAHRVASRLAEFGLATKTEHAATGPRWVIQGQKTMVPDKLELLILRKKFDALAATEQGEYDGWGTEVVNLWLLDIFDLPASPHFR